MYLISRSANLCLPIRDRKVTYHPTTGVVIDVKPAISVQFQPAGAVPDYAKEAVSKLPDWGRGVGHNEDPFTRCGSFDTDEAGLDAETKAEVEAVLRKIAGSSFVIADPPRAAKPWPNYDAVSGTEEQAAEIIGRKVVEDGYDPKTVADYERQNEKRELVLAVLDRLAEESEPDVVGVISA